MPTTHYEWQKAFEVQELAMDSTGATSLGVPERRWFPAYLHLITTTAPSILGVAALSIGTNASAYNNILPITLLTGLGGADTGRQVVLGTHIVVPAEEEIFVNITTAATGGGIIHVILSGWWLDYDVEGAP